MQKQTAFHLMFNAVGVVLGLVLVAYLLHSAFETDMEPPCSKRYPAPMRFALKAGDGTLLTAIGLQAHIGAREWGVIENASIVADGPGGAALEVKLAPVAGREQGNGRPANGVDFPWTPNGVGKASSACLSYSVWLPEDFAFLKGGLLPGIYGGQPDGASEEVAEASRFGTRIRWRADGVGELDAENEGSGYKSVNQHGVPLPRGRWTRIEQEIVLNKAGATNGQVRMWVDGKLEADNDKLALRKDAAGRLSGVLADIGYLRDPRENETALRISPFEFSWR